MADTRCQIECEAWVRDHWLNERFLQPFSERKVSLETGGEFKFDAVSADGGIVVSISTSRAKMSGGKKGVGKLMKLRADMLFHRMAVASRHVMVFTEPCMYEACRAEKQRGKVPAKIELLLAELPKSLAALLAASREKSSQEVRARSRREEV
jgi:hypothetical protein